VGINTQAAREALKIEHLNKVNGMTVVPGSSGQATI
jgi:hypothetical protein